MNNQVKPLNIAHTLKALNEKKVIAYPTEAVFGIGCDPDSKTAVCSLLKLKKRSIKQGLIIVAADFDQIKPYINEAKLAVKHWKILLSAWPGPVTFTIPAKLSTPYWLTGYFNSLAVRITNYQPVIELCRAFGKPLISTSANLAGLTPCLTKKEVLGQFGRTFHVVDGNIGGQAHVSEIYDLLTGKRFR